MTLDPSIDVMEQILDIAARAVYGSDSANTATSARMRLDFEIDRFLDETGDIKAVFAAAVAAGEKRGLITRESNGQFSPPKSTVSAPASAGVEADDDDGQPVLAPQEATVEVPDSSSATPPSATAPADAEAGDDEGLTDGVSTETIVRLPDPSPATSSSETNALAEKSVSATVSETISTDHRTSAVNAAIAAVSVENDEAGLARSAANAANSAVPVSSPSTASIAARASARAQVGAAIFAFKMGSGREIGSYRYSELRRAELESRADAKVFRRIREFAQPSSDLKISEYFAADVLAKIVGKRGASLVNGRKVRRARKSK